MPLPNQAEILSGTFAESRFGDVRGPLSYDIDPWFFPVFFTSRKGAAFMIRGVSVRRTSVGISLCCTLVIVGCSPKPPAPAVPATGGTAAAPNKVVAAEVEDQLKSGLYQLQPENLGVDSRLEDAVSVLNNWWSAVKSAELVPTGLTPPAIPAALLPEDVRAQLERELFGNEDGLHIRNAYFAKQIADHVSAKTDQELDRIVKIFYWVCRNVDLVPEDEPVPPLPFYDLVILGRGRALDRAIVFSELLRQMHLDCVILYPEGELEADTPWITGVLLDGKVYLFDPRLGSPIPRGDGSASGVVTVPATLEDLLTHPEWLTALAARADQPYEPSIEQLQTAQVGVVTSVMNWSPRMWRIEQLLPGDQLCVLYEAPEKLGDAPSVFERIGASFPGKPAAQIVRFSDPLLQNPPDQTDRTMIMRNMQLAQATLAVPFAPAKDDVAAGGPLVPTQRQLKTRTQQLQGRYADAIAQFVSIRQLGTGIAPEPTLGPIYARAAEDAFFWSCLCKVDAGQYESAISVLTDYLKRYRRGGRWLVGARQALADCYIARQQWAEAIETLKQSIPDDPARASTAVQIKRLSALSTEKKE